MSFSSVNPYDGTIVGSYKEEDFSSAIGKVKASHQVFKQWSRVNIFDRISIVQQITDILEQNKGAWAEMMMLEMGKLKRDGIAEIDKCKWLVDYYAEHAGYFLESTDIATDYKKSYVRFDPLGPILCIMPWNYPFWQVFRFAIPALIAGNTVLLKHASNVQGCAQAITSIFDHETFPENLFQNIGVKGSHVSELIEMPEIRGISLTGSVEVGKMVAVKAGASLKKCVLELGGSDPYIILKDANLEKAVNACSTGRIMNAGQSCIGAKRFIVVPEIRDHFIALFKSKFETFKMGDPVLNETDIGPMASLYFRNELHQQVTDSINKGARCIIGGEIPQEKGAFYLPTILTNVQPGMPAYDDELFGPVASVIDAKDEQDAIRIANDTNFGLGAAVFTEDIERGQKVAAQLEAGCCFINDFVKSDPRLPFGGVKDSGYGRELSLWGIREFCNVKTVVVK